MPTGIRIPSIGVSRSRLVTLRTLDTGSLESPKRYGDVGWWKAGPVPGQEGAAVVVGHLDSPTGPAVFANLATLRPGARISVGRSDRRTVSFVVRNVELFPRSSFPGDRVYREGGPPGLVLITCGGQYDRNAGHYLSNVVVFADLLPTDKATAAPSPAGQTTAAAAKAAAR